MSLKPVPTPAKNQTPSFSGSTSEKTPVTIFVYEGKAAEGNVVSEAKATVSGSKCTCSWSSAPAAPALKSGKHVFTAIAKQSSEIARQPGRRERVRYFRSRHDGADRHAQHSP